MPRRSRSPRRVTTPRKPWALAWAPDGQTLLATHLLGPGVSAMRRAHSRSRRRGPCPTRAARADPTEPHGLVRGIYDVVARPGTTELWVAHLMLGTDTPQPTLVFDNTVFPALSILDRRQRRPAGAPLGRGRQLEPGRQRRLRRRRLRSARRWPSRATGKYAFVVDTDSEDLLVVDATQRVEAADRAPAAGPPARGRRLVARTRSTSRSATPRTSSPSR